LKIERKKSTQLGLIRGCSHYRAWFIHQAIIC
jgi:hypothetical protein